jgi:hypothetical protein
LTVARVMPGRDFIRSSSLSAVSASDAFTAWWIESASIGRVNPPANRGQVVHCHDPEAAGAGARGLDPRHMPGELRMNDDRAALHVA